MITRLTEMRVGARARLHSHELPESDQQLIEAIGITLRSELRVIQQGEPCIVQVRDTRVGLTAPVAARLKVIPVELAEATTPASAPRWGFEDELDAALDAS